MCVCVCVWNCKRIVLFFLCHQQNFMLGLSLLWRKTVCRNGNHESWKDFTFFSLEFNPCCFFLDFFFMCAFVNALRNYVERSIIIVDCLAKYVIIAQKSTTSNQCMSEDNVGLCMNKNVWRTIFGRDNESLISCTRCMICDYKINRLAMLHGRSTQLTLTIHDLNAMMNENDDGYRPSAICHCRVTNITFLAQMAHM